MPGISFADDSHAAQRKRVTALYLYNFLLFVDWPEGAVSASNILRVGILGDPQLYEALKAMSGKMVKGKKLMIVPLTRPREIYGCCHVLFVGDVDKDVVRRFLGKLDGKPVLTLSDQPDFVGLGGMVAFKNPKSPAMGEIKEKRFIINLSAVRNAGLQVRSRLLRISDIVDNVAPGPHRKDPGSYPPP